MTTDRTVNLELYADLAGRKLVTRDGSAFNLAPVTLGDELLCTLRALERPAGGEPIEAELPVRTLLASVGKVMEPPTSGAFQLRSPYGPPLPAFVEVQQSEVAPGGGIVAVRCLGFFEGSESTVVGFPIDYQDTPDLAAAILFVNAQEQQVSAEAIPGGVRISSQSLEHTALEIDFADLAGEIVTRRAEPLLSSLTSAPISSTADAAAFSAAVAPLLPSAPTEVTLAAPSCWLFRLADGSKARLFEHANRLAPASRVRIREFERFDGEWWHEVRLIQAPLAWNADGHERILPPPPAVRQIRAGAAATETSPAVNELQALFIPPDFRGTYFVRWNYYSTAVLGTDDGPDEIAEALNAMHADGKARFAVTNPENNNAYIEFLGPLAAAPQPLATVEVNSFLPGTLTFRLPLNRPELHAALRDVPKIDLPFEVQAELGDPNTPEAPGRIVTLFRHTLTIEREEIYAELATANPHDWLTRIARDYIPFTPDQIIFGVQHYVCTFGDGEQRNYGFAHNLGTSAFTPFVRQNAALGRALVLGTDYSLTFPNDNQLLLELLPGYPTPPANGLAIVLSSAGPKSAFLAHTHTIAQVLGLTDILAQINARLENLEDLLPQAQLARREQGEPSEIEFPDRTEVFPGRLPENFDASKLSDANSALEAVKGGRPGALLPAVHDATVAEFAAMPAFTAVPANNVVKNTGAADWQISGGGGRRTERLEPGGFAATDGRFLYAVSRAGQTNSFFPRAGERELILFHCNDQMWQPGGNLELRFKLELSTIAANTRVQWVLVIEAGTAPGQDTPAPTAPNLEKITWAAKPLLEQRLILSEARLPHAFGIHLKRAENNTITGERLQYTAWTQAPAEAMPSSPAVVLRARLERLDTENSVKGATGFLFFKMTEAKARIA